VAFHRTRQTDLRHAFCEAFNARFRDECLNETLFRDIGHARRVITDWVHDYNNHRPHSAIGYLTPATYAATLNGKGADALEPSDRSAHPPLAKTAQSGTFNPPALLKSG